MKYLFYTYLFATTFLFVSCRGGGGPAGAGADSASVAGPVDKRIGLIAALKELQREAASNDSVQVSKMFQFPIADTLQLFGDSVFQAKRAEAGETVSEALFFSGYSHFVQELEYPELLEVFQHLDVSRLRSVDSIGIEVKSDTGCKQGFMIQITRDSLIAIQSWQAGASGYSGQGSADDSKCEEFLLNWWFVFDGKRLVMREHGEAD